MGRGAGTRPGTWEQSSGVPAWHGTAGCWHLGAGHCALPWSGKPSSCGLLGWSGVCSEGWQKPNPFPCSCSAPGRAAQRPGEPSPCPGGAASSWDSALSSCHPTAWPCSCLVPAPRCVWMKEQGRKRTWGKRSSIPGEGTKPRVPPVPAAALRGDTGDFPPGSAGCPVQPGVHWGRGGGQAVPGHTAPVASPRPPIPRSRLCAVGHRGCAAAAVSRHQRGCFNRVLSVRG